jgi:nitrogen-specific signal transduction histidine kinase
MISEFTKFAPAKRASDSEIEADYEILNNTEWIKSFLNTMPEVVAILNPERQIIFGNDELMKLLEISDLKKMIGKRPGEALKCVNSSVMEAGCGTCEKCRYCGAVNSILESQLTSSKVTKDCRITTEENGLHEFLDLKVTTAPFSFNDNLYFILSIEDISDRNRRAILERLFFHDILNIVGSLKGISDLLIRSNNDADTSEKYIGIVNDLSKELLEEILAQRVMVFAEQGDLQPSFSPVNTLEILNDSVNYLSHHKVSKEKIIEIDLQASSISISSDPMLLKRVILNMLKNALEATPKGGKVSLNCKQVDSVIQFTVRNPGQIPIEVQSQIFQRSFSTKGKGRGLGTYSIKLLTERYLNGSVGFTSTTEDGTEFFVKTTI